MANICECCPNSVSGKSTNSQACLKCLSGFAERIEREESGAIEISPSVKGARHLGLITQYDLDNDALTQLIYS